MPPVEQFAYRQVELDIEARIASGQLKAGQRLPSLRSMAERMGLSVGTIVAAYAELERKGLAQARPRSGYFVRSAPLAMREPSEPGPLPARAELISRSALIRQVLEALGGGGMLSLGLPLPVPELLPTAHLTRLLHNVMRKMGSRALDYAPVRGLPELRREIALRALDAGAEVRASDILITNGALEALGIALRCVARPGDSVVIASPTYYCLLELLEAMGLRAIEVACRPGEGVRPVEVAEAVERCAASALVLTPNFNNPDGSLMSDEAKAHVAQMAASRQLPIIEDDVYGDLVFPGQRRPSILRAHSPEPDLVLSLGSFSKTLAPGFRVGWLAPGRYMPKALQLKATTTICTATPMQAAIAEFLAHGAYDRHLRGLRTTVKRHMQSMRAAIGRFFPPETRVTNPQGGLQLWVELPGAIDSVDFFLRAWAQGIGVCPGAVFSPTDHYDSFIRLCYGVTWTPTVEDALARLGRMAEEAVEAKNTR